MTFLEFVAQRLMGPPLYGSCWHCPYCDSSGPSFSVRPPKAGYKVKFKCHRCDAWGDEFDLLKLFHPLWGFSLRKLKLIEMKDEYERENPTTTETSNYHRGPGSTESMNHPKSARNDSRDVELAWANLIAELRDEETSEAFALQILTQFKKHCTRKEVSMDVLLAYWRGFENWKSESLQRHAAECDVTSQ